ncbi:DUF1516 family protein [Apilactobacillus timberlakei]|uniref:DUF1516 family protein n=1 Tax=Apilactobacillus timberlakei TaxID=2008380 RepID=UPI00112A3FCC|nr:DUF1516 family protein [Apilactobacillus timberlakei]TPR19254.1 DUF1516 family protein [Apilactobacillus timberlakei]
MYLWIHLIFAILLIALISLSIFKKKGFMPYMMITRVTYLVFIVTGTILFFKAYDRNPVFAILKALAAVMFIAMLEMNFAEKTKNRLTKGMVISLYCALILLFIIGFITAGGRPFV